MASRYSISDTVKKKLHPRTQNKKNNEKSKYVIVIIYQKIKQDFILKT